MMPKELSKYLPEFIRSPDPNVYKSNSYVCLDFETTSTDKGSALLLENKIVLAVWRLGCGHPQYKEGAGSNLYVKRAGEFELSELVVACEQADFLVAHNAKFELQWLHRCGIDISKILVYDTMLAEYVLLGNRKGRLDLSSVAGRYGLGGKDELVSRLIKGGVDPTDVPDKWLEKYCIKDAELTEEVFLNQREKLYDENLSGVFYTRCLLTPVLADIERHGIKVDEQRARELYEQKERELASVSARLAELTSGINPNSPKQLGEFLYDILNFEELTDRRGNPLRTPAGGRKTDAATLERLHATTDAQQQFLLLKKEQAKLNGDVTKYLRKLVECCEESDGILLANLNQTRTATHRLSSTGKKHNIQLQNINRNFKKLFTARHKGWFVGEVDGAQLEFRVAAYLGQDLQGMEDIRQGVDKHQFTSDVLTQAGQPTNRQDAKTHTFKPLYGGMSGTKAEQAYYQAFRERHNQLYEVQKGWTYEVLKNKKLVTPWGLIFYWPDTSMSRTGFISNTQSIFNYPVQSLATAEIIPIAVVCMWHMMKALKMESFLTNTIHDSAIAEIHPKERELFTSVAVQCFTTCVYEYLYKVYGMKFNVPLGAGVKIGTHWSEGQEVKYESTPLYN